MNKKLVGKQKQKVRLIRLITKNGLRIIKYEDIKTPTTVEEFRENLRRYVCGFGPDAIYVQGHDGIAIDKISSFSDIYNLTGTGFCGDGTSPSICLTVDWSFEGNGDFSDDGYWKDEDSKCTIYEGEENMINKLSNPSWVTLDNQVLRGLYVKMFGDFSGYVDVCWTSIAQEEFGTREQ